MAAPPIPSKPRLALLLSFVGFAFGGMGKGLGLPHRAGKADGGFSALSAELIAGNEGAPFPLRGEATSLGKLRARGRAWDVFGDRSQGVAWAGISRPFGAERAISTMQVIEERIQLAKELDAATKHGEDFGLTDDELPHAGNRESARLRCTCGLTIRSL